MGRAIGAGWGRSGRGFSVRSGLGSEFDTGGTITKASAGPPAGGTVAGSAGAGAWSTGCGGFGDRGGADGRKARGTRNTATRGDLPGISRLEIAGTCGAPGSGRNDLGARITVSADGRAATAAGGSGSRGGGAEGTRGIGGGGAGVPTGSGNGPAAS
jgi:hypothetical protein